MENLNINDPPTGFTDLPYDARRIIFRNVGRELPESDRLIDLQNEKLDMEHRLDRVNNRINQFRRQNLIPPEMRFIDDDTGVEILSREIESMNVDINRLNSVFQTKARQLNRVMRERNELPFK